MTRLYTRVCTRCRKRKALGEFYVRRDRGRRMYYRSECKRCTCGRVRRHRIGVHPPRVRIPRTFRCRYCHREALAKSPNQEVCKALTCQTQLRAARNRHGGDPIRRTCVDCGGIAYFRRCDPCRAKHQAAVEAELDAMPGRADLCACGELLEFSSDPMTGISLERCPVCGERPIPIVGRRQYDQRVTLDEEIEEAVERSGRAPDTRFRSYGSGMHFRQKSYEFTRKSA